MENLKYWIFGLGLILLSFGWYSKSEDTSHIVKERLLSNKEKIKYIKNVNTNTWYFKRSKYIIKKVRDIIPFTYKEIDTLKKPIVEYFSTEFPENYNKHFIGDSCGCD